MSYTLHGVLKAIIDGIEEAVTLSRIIYNGTNFPVVKYNSNNYVIIDDNIITELGAEILLISAINNGDLEGLRNILPHVPTWMLVDNPYFPKENEYHKSFYDNDIRFFLNENPELEEEILSQLAEAEVKIDDEFKILKGWEDKDVAYQRLVELRNEYHKTVDDILFTLVSDGCILKYATAVSRFSIEIVATLCWEFDKVHDLPEIMIFLKDSLLNEYDSYLIKKQAVEAMKMKEALLTIERHNKIWGCSF